MVKISENFFIFSPWGHRKAFILRLWEPMFSIKKSLSFQTIQRTEGFILILASQLGSTSLSRYWEKYFLLTVNFLRWLSRWLATLVKDTSVPDIFFQLWKYGVSFLKLTKSFSGLGLSIILPIFSVGWLRIRHPYDTYVTSLRNPTTSSKIHEGCRRDVVRSQRGVVWMSYF